MKSRRLLQSLREEFAIKKKIRSNRSKRSKQSKRSKRIRRTKRQVGGTKQLTLEQWMSIPEKDKTTYVTYRYLKENGLDSGVAPPTIRSNVAGGDAASVSAGAQINLEEKIPVTVNISESGFDHSPSDLFKGVESLRFSGSEY